jgi:hypothetical protein
MTISVAYLRVARLFACVLLFAAAASVARGQFVYTTADGVATITGYSGPGGAIAIPSVVDGFPVRQIGAKAFMSKDAITSVTMPASIVSIGSEAFANCTTLSSVTLPDGIQTIAVGTFSNCGSLQRLDFPAGVTNIENYAFTFCGLTNLNLPPSLQSIGNVAFGSCSSLVRVVVPKSVVSIGVYAFSACTELRAVYFEGDRPFIGSDAFVNDSKLTIYYTADADGWTSTVGGRPATLWNPRIVTDDGKLGFSLNQFGFTVSGSSGVVVIVETTADLSNPNWAPIGTNTLTTATWSFQTPGSGGNAFFRLRAP